MSTTAKVCFFRGKTEERDEEGERSSIGEEIRKSPGKKGNLKKRFRAGTWQMDIRYAYSGKIYSELRGSMKDKNKILRQ